MTRKALSIALVLTAAALGGAASSEATVDVRQARQHARIVDGRLSGELTRRESVGLALQQAHIRREERFYRATGGGLGPLERLDLQRDLNRASRNIHRQKHDGQSRHD
jgi:hypothetical protein